MYIYLGKNPLFITGHLSLINTHFGNPSIVLGKHIPSRFAICKWWNASWYHTVMGGGLHWDIPPLASGPPPEFNVEYRTFSGGACHQIPLEGIQRFSVDFCWRSGTTIEVDLKYLWTTPPTPNNHSKYCYLNLDPEHWIGTLPYWHWCTYLCFIVT